MSGAEEGATADERKVAVWQVLVGDPCEFCGEPAGDHTLSELRSCVADLRARSWQ